MSSGNTLRLETFALSAVGGFTALYVLENILHVPILHHAPTGTSAIKPFVSKDMGATKRPCEPAKFGIQEIPAFAFDCCEYKCKDGDPCVGGTCEDAGCPNATIIDQATKQRVCVCGRNGQIPCKPTTRAQTKQIMKTLPTSDKISQGPVPIGPSSSPIQDIIGGFQNALGNLFGTNKPTPVVGATPAPVPVAPVVG